jgi:transcriptional regulator with AAA-type ATPase domain
LRVLPHFWFAGRVSRLDDTATRDLRPPGGLVLVDIKSGRRYELPREARLVVGRDPSAHIRLDNVSVSREHVRVEVGDEVFVEELGSKNGTRVGGRALAKGERALVAPGTVLEVGDVLLVVQLEPRSLDAMAPPARAPDVALPFLAAPEGPMKRVLELVQRIAPDDISVLLTGETGVGKEVVARALHELSHRRTGPFVPVHAAALAESVIESELFGHERGAFTGASQQRIGLFESASGGTLFLDEVGEIPLSVQAKLLRVLEERTLRRVGSTKAIPIDVRIVSATNRNLRAAAQTGVFREDLLFRLAGFSITIPPLRDRPGEIESLARFLLDKAAAERGRAVPAWTTVAFQKLAAHSYPGNVRELRNVVSRALVLAGSKITAEHIVFDEEVPRANSPPTAAPSGRSFTAAETEERDRIAQALTQTGGNQKKAAELLGVPLRTFVYRLKRLDIKLRAKPKAPASGAPRLAGERPRRAVRRGPM